MNKPLSEPVAPSDEVTYVWPRTGVNPGDQIEIYDDETRVGTCLVDEHFSRTKLSLRIKRAIVPQGTIPTNYALAPIIIPGHTGPLPDGAWGINIAAAKDNFPHNGLQIFIDAWEGMAEHDTVDILIDDVSVASKPVRENEVKQQVTMFVKPERLSDGAHQVKYRITPVIGSPDASPPQDIFVKLNRPGGQDQNGDIPGHSELTFELPQAIIENGVGPDDLNTGVDITIHTPGKPPYPNAAENDEIRVAWGWVIVMHTVTAQQAAGTAPIIINVDRTVIEKAGDSNSLAVTFEVYDVVQNRSEDWAAEKRILVDVASLRIDSPTIEETDYDEQTGRQSIDLGKHTTIRAGVYVPPSGSNFAVGDKVEMRLRGTTAEGEVVDEKYPLAEVTRLGYFLTIPLSFEHVRRLATSQAIFSFEVVKKDNSPNIPSKGLYVAIVGELPTLAAPSVKEVEGNVIDPDLPEATVLIEWDQSMRNGMTIELKWLGTRPDTSTYLPTLAPHTISGNEETNKQLRPIYVDGRHLKEIDGGTLELYYVLYDDVRRQAIGSRESAHSPLFRVGDPRGELEKPSIEEVIGGALDPALREATMVVPNYLGKVRLDKIHIEWKLDPQGDALYTDWTTVSTTNERLPIKFYIEKSVFDYSQYEGQKLYASYYVVRANNNGTAQSDHFDFTIGEPAEGELPEPEIELIENGNLDLAKVPDTGVLTLMTKWADIGAGDGLKVVWTVDGQDQPIEIIERDISGNDLLKPKIERTFKKATAEASDGLDVNVQYFVTRLGKRQ
ncbi:hypothetical protein ACTWM0_17450 [Pseudomonas machongensis]